MFAAGVGGARDDASAARWELAAAEAGSAEGCLRVAARVAARPGGMAQAIAWLGAAAEAGSGEAAARLSYLYFMGRRSARGRAGAAERWKAIAPRALGWKSESAVNPNDVGQCRATPRNFFFRASDNHIGTIRLFVRRGSAAAGVDDRVQRLFDHDVATPLGRSPELAKVARAI